MVNINLLNECGEFCTERTHAKLPWLRSQVEAAIKSNSSVTFERAGIKILSPSFIDELLSELALQHGIDSIHQNVKFNPPLEAIYETQIQRGVRLRSAKKPTP